MFPLDVPVIAIEGDEASLEALSARNLSKVQPVRVNLFSQHSIVDSLPECQPGIGVVLDPPRDGLKEREALKPWFTRASGLPMFPVILQPGNATPHFCRGVDWSSTRYRDWICFRKHHTLRSCLCLLGGLDRLGEEF